MLAALAAFYKNRGSRLRLTCHPPPATIRRCPRPSAFSPNSNSTTARPRTGPRATGPAVPIWRFRMTRILDHETWIRPAFAKLGELRGKRTLDYGCGHGMAAVVLARAARRSAHSTCRPITSRKHRHERPANGVRVECRLPMAEELPFPDDSFDVVWGNAILHHLDLARAGTRVVPRDEARRGGGVLRALGRQSAPGIRPALAPLPRQVPHSG